MNVERLGIAISLMLMTAFATAAKPQCGSSGIYMQVLGSGGPEMSDQRASAGYLVWQDGRARVLVDIGPGSILRYEQSGADFDDLEVILLSHLHVDHSADLPALMKAAFFTDRLRDLPIYGPSGNSFMPGTTAFIETLFAENGGAYRYLSDYLAGDAAFRLLSHDVSASDTTVQQVMVGKGFRVAAVAVHHGPIPSLAWRVDIDGRSITFSGDMNGDSDTLPKLAAGTDLLVAHHAIPQDAKGVARNLHMPPSVIGEIAAAANVKQLVLSHRMTRTLGREVESQSQLSKHYNGVVQFADDGQCFKI
jgi:ribonuclease BN (tRNA processing enzyme)